MNAPEEDDDHQRDDERDADDRQRDADQHGVDHGDRRDAAHVAGGGAPDFASCPLDQLAVALGGQRREPAPHAPAVVDEEEEQHDQQQQPRHQLGENGSAGEDPLADAAGVLAQRGETVVHGAVDVGPGEVEGTLDKPAHHLRDGFVDAVLELSELVDERGRDQDDHADQGGRAHRHHEEGGERARPAVPAQQVDGGTRKVASSRASSTGTTTTRSWPRAQSPTTIAASRRIRLKATRVAGQSARLTGSFLPGLRRPKPRRLL